MFTPVCPRSVTVPATFEVVLFIYFYLLDHTETQREGKTDQQLSLSSPLGGKQWTLCVFKVKLPLTVTSQGCQISTLPWSSPLETAAVTGSGAALWNHLGDRKAYTNPNYWIPSMEVMVPLSWSNSLTQSEVKPPSSQSLGAHKATELCFGVKAGFWVCAYILYICTQACFIMRCCSKFTKVCKLKNTTGGVDQLQGTEPQTLESSLPWIHQNLVKAVSSDNEQWHHKQKMNL